MTHHQKAPAEKVVKDIRRATRRRFGAEERSGSFWRACAARTVSPSCAVVRAKIRIENGGAKVLPDLDPPDEELHQPRLLDGEQLVPQRIERMQSLADLGLSHGLVLLLSLPPRPDDDLRATGRREQR